MKHSRIGITVSAVICILLTGCAGTYTRVGKTDWRNSDWDPPVGPPKIIFGQKAYVWGERIDVVQESGLFSSVEKAKSRVPPMNGVLITNECRSRDADRSFFGGLLHLLTLGLIPNMYTYDEYCTMNFYQNGINIVSDKMLSQKYYLQTGWFTSFYADEDAVWKDASRGRFNTLLKSIK